MKRRFMFETGNWELAAEFLHKREPDQFDNVAAAKEFLRKEVLNEFGDVPPARMIEVEPWYYGPIGAWPSSVIQGTAEETFERVEISFWLRPTTTDRSDTEVFR